MEYELIRIFCDIDDFCKTYKNYCEIHLLSNSIDKKYLLPSSRMDLSEIMTLMIHFHQSGYRCFKWYYNNYISIYFKKNFPKLLSYNRFVELMKYSLVPMLVYTSKYKMGECTGISFVDSTPLKVCHHRRIHNHKVFKGIAERGKSSTGWFYGFKLHIIVNEKGELLSFSVTPGNTSDKNINLMDKLSKGLYGKMFGDKGYVSQKLFDKLFSKSIMLITKIKKNMKNKLIEIEDKILLRKRAIIESVNDFLKNICQIEHSRHRILTNFLVNLVSGLSAYCFIEKKPSLNLKKCDIEQLLLK